LTSILVRNPEWSRPFERTRRRWGDNIKGHLKQMDTKAWTG